MYHYEGGLFYFIVGVYSEYQKIVESALSAQYPDCSIETIKRPNVFPKKYSHIMAMKSAKDSIYTIKMYKQSPDDQINNIIDAIAKIPSYDSFSIVMPMKPMGEQRNKEAKRVAEALFKNDEKALKKTSLLKAILMPRKLI